MERVFGTLGAISALAAVAAGAFGAHSLRGRLTADQLAVLKTAARYQIYHALALLFVSGTMTRGGGRLLELSGWMFVAGTLLFSGSLYALVLTGVRSLGAVTPLGGLAFLAGWAFLALGAWRPAP